MCSFASAGQGTTMQNGRAIPKNCNAALCACKIAQSAPERKHLEDENEIYRKGYYIYNVKIVKKRLIEESKLKIHTSVLLTRY